MENTNGNIIETTGLDSCFTQAIGCTTFKHHLLDIIMRHHIVQSVRTKHIGVARQEIGSKLIEIEIRILTASTNAIGNDVGMLSLTTFIAE